MIMPRPTGRGGARQQGQALREPNPYMELAAGPPQSPNTSSWLSSYAPAYANASLLDNVMEGGGAGAGGINLRGSGTTGQEQADRIRRLRAGRV